MKTLFTFYAILTVAVLFAMAASSEPDGVFSTPVASGVSVFTNSRAIHITPIPGQRAVAVVSVLTNTPASLKQTHFAPGVYAAKSYSMIVVVPPPTGDKMIVAADNPDPKMPVIVPELHLEKR